MSVLRVRVLYLPPLSVYMTGMVVETFVSTDVETDGPIPGRNSMLSFGSVALSEAGAVLGKFSANLELLEGAVPDPKTKSEFWDRNPEAWAACRLNPQPIRKTMVSYVSWVRQLPGKPVFVGYPATFDFMWVHWYIIAHGLDNPFSFSALDMKSYAMAKLGTSFRETTKRNMPKHWFPEGRPHTHVAVEDAHEQGELFLNMLRHK